MMPAPSLLVALLALLFILGLRFRHLYIETRARIEAQRQNLDEGGIRLHLGMLLKRGYEGGFVIFTERGTDRFVQFRKYITTQSDFGLELHLPRVSWSEPFFDQVHQALKNLGLPTRIWTTDDGMDVVHAELGQDVALATKAVYTLFREVYGLENPRIDVTGDGISPFDELIDRKGRPSLRDNVRKLRSVRRRAT